MTITLTADEKAAAVGLAGEWNDLIRIQGGTGQIDVTTAIRMMITTATINEETKRIHQRYLAALDKKENSQSSTGNKS